jgi:hypothetical protein
VGGEHATVFWVHGLLMRVEGLFSVLLCTCRFQSTNCGDVRQAFSVVSSATQPSLIRPLALACPTFDTPHDQRPHRTPPFCEALEGQREDNGLLAPSGRRAGQSTPITSSPHPVLASAAMATDCATALYVPSPLNSTIIYSTIYPVLYLSCGLTAVHL